MVRNIWSAASGEAPTAQPVSAVNMRRLANGGAAFPTGLACGSGEGCLLVGVLPATGVGISTSPASRAGVGFSPGSTVHAEIMISAMRKVRYLRIYIQSAQMLPSQGTALRI